MRLTGYWRGAGVCTAQYNLIPMRVHGPAIELMLLIATLEILAILMIRFGNGLISTIGLILGIVVVGLVVLWHLIKTLAAVVEWIAGRR